MRQSLAVGWGSPARDAQPQRTKAWLVIRGPLTRSIGRLTRSIRGDPPPNQTAKTARITLYLLCGEQKRPDPHYMAVVGRPTKRHACPVSVYAYWERIVFVRDFLHLTRGGPKGLALLRCRALPKRKDNTGAGGGSGGRSPPRNGSKLFLAAPSKPRPPEASQTFSLSLRNLDRNWARKGHHLHTGSVFCVDDMDFPHLVLRAPPLPQKPLRTLHFVSGPVLLPANT